MEKELTIVEPENYKQTKDACTKILKELTENLDIQIQPAFNIYDMLVFEDTDGSIYQDCVCAIENNHAHINYVDNSEDEYTYLILCNNTEIYLDSKYKILNIILNDPSGYYTDKLKLKEIWTRTDEDTYKRVWSK